VNKSRFFLLLGLTIAASASIFTTPIDAAGPTANDLVAAVNAYRVANGYYAMNPHPLVFQAAQTHAEWIVATGQGGHIGAGGSDETMRVSWTGYGGGATIQCDENWSSGATIDDAVYGAWSDWVHQEVMLNQWGNRYTDIGGGVAAWGEGRYVFILNVCKIVGQEASGDVPVPPGGNGPAAVPPTPDYSNFIYGVTTATPQFDGTVIHVVRYGQSLLSIAQAYGITIEELRALNGFAPDFVAIWPDDELIIKQGTGETAPTPSPTVEAEQATPTATVRPTYTPSSMEMTATAEAAGKVEETADSVTKPTLTAGLVLLLSAGLALVILVYFSGGRNE
jgi:LysM repeat protein